MSNDLIVFQDGQYLCNVGQSMNQLFYNVYSTVALAEVKGYTMIQFSYMILRIYSNGNVSILELM